MSDVDRAGTLLNVSRVMRILCAGLVIAACASVTALPAAAGTRSCGTVNGGTVQAIRVSCAKARSVIGYALKHHSGNAPKGPKGWSCARGPSPAVSEIAVECLRRRQIVRLLNHG